MFLGSNNLDEAKSEPKPGLDNTSIKMVFPDSKFGRKFMTIPGFSWVGQIRLFGVEQLFVSCRESICMYLLRHFITIYIHTHITFTTSRCSYCRITSKKDRKQTSTTSKVFACFTSFFTSFGLHVQKQHQLEGTSAYRFSRLATIIAHRYRRNVFVELSLYQQALEQNSRQNNYHCNGKY